MQTISVPYSVDDDGRKQLDELRRIQSAAIRTAYANAMTVDGKKVPEKDLRHLVKQRFAGGICDAWLLHCATLDGIAKRKARPDGDIIFGGKKHLRRLSKKLIDKDEWKRRRLQPLLSMGNETWLGNRHFRLSADGATCRVSVYKKPIVLGLSSLNGKWNELLREVAQAAIDKSINLTFRLDDNRLHITFDPTRLKKHAERRSQLKLKKRRVLGIDSNPNWIGVSIIEMPVDGSDNVKILDWKLFDLKKANKQGRDKAKFELSQISESIVDLTRHWRCSVVALEDLSMPSRNHKLGKAANKLRNNTWQRRFLEWNLTRKAGLAGLDVRPVWAAYSSIVGNIRHDLPDAVAAATEIARRGYFFKDRKRSFPVCDVSGLPQLWKQKADLNGVTDWNTLNGKLKQANIWVRRPHPVTASRLVCGDRFMSRESLVRLWRARSRDVNPVLHLSVDRARNGQPPTSNDG